MSKVVSYVFRTLFIGLIVGFFYFHIQGNNMKPLVDTHVKVYVDQWMRDMDDAGLDYEIKTLDYVWYTDSVPGDAAGYTDFLKRSIYVKNDKRYTDIHLKVIVYHELGHYFFKLNHKEGGIMESSLGVDEFRYRDNWYLYLDQYIKDAKAKQ